MRADLIVLADRSPSPATARLGVETAIERVLRERDGIWLARRNEPSTCDRFCDRALWPLFHGLLDRVRYATEDWTRYARTNATYAERALELVTHDGAVWAYGYHWLLVAAELRAYGHRGPIGLFLDVPFPTPELLDTLPWRDELLRGMRAFDLVGFHARQWGDHLEACLGRSHVLGPRISVFPFGVDPDELGAPPPDEPIMHELALHDRRLIVGIDHLDPAGGITERLLAFEQLLEQHAPWRGRVILTQIAVPSRIDAAEHDDLQRRVEKLVGRINGRFGEADWVPIRYLSRDCDPGLLAQLYRAADVALMTPLRDGSSQLPLEIVRAQDPERPGVLVLSRFAGTASILEGALLTNPYHPDGVAADLDRALRMPLEERRRRHQQLTASAVRSTPRQWVASFVDQLFAASPRRSAPNMWAASS